MNTNLPPILETKLADFRRRVWIVKLTEGLLAAVFGLLVSYLVVFVLDRFFETPGWVRALMLVTGAATLGIGLPLKWHRWVWQQRRLEDAARLLRATFPRLGDRLLGIVELARMEHVAGRSERLVEAAMAQAADAVKDQDFSRAVPHARHRQWGWAAGGVGVLSLGAFLIVNDAARNAFARWMMPWGQVERYTFARVEQIPSHLVVPYAEPFDLPVRLAITTRQIPDEATARIAKQPKVEAKLLNGSTYPLSFPPQKQEGVMALSVGDVRKNVVVEPRVRPELADVGVRLRLPSYLGYQSEQRLEVRGGSARVVKGAEAAFEGRANCELATAEMDGRPQKVIGGQIQTGYTPITQNTEWKFTWKDHDGLTPRDPLVLKVEAVEDEAPKVVAKRESLEQVVLDSEVVTFDVNATDDFGVKCVGIDWIGSNMNPDGKTPITGEKVVAAGEPEKKEQSVRATFCAVREGVAPQTIEVRAWADDYLPGRQHARSAAFVLHILNKTDHALWLTEQFGKWLEAAKESYEREQQLHQTNKELRSLDASDLDRPQNRRRVSQQAAAENANAARLDGLTQSGRNLVEQATKNDEFDAKRLESWATMLKALKDIAANRMPSVSDLLKQTASAPGKPGESNPNNSSPQQSQPGKVAEAAKPQDAKSTPSVSHGENPQSQLAAAPQIDPDAAPKPPAPSISDRETTFSKPEPNAPASPGAPKPPGGGKLRLPNTTLAAAPNKKGDDAPKPPESPAQQKMDSAIQEQKDLLAEFAKVSDQLNEILSSLEASTFVKRFKAASRGQMKIATGISQKTLDAFGIEREPVKEAEAIAKNAKDQSEVVRVIQSDLDAYFQRKQDSRFKSILDQMKKMEVVRALSREGENVSINLTGQSVSGSEYWADTFDRWAEELVAASNCKSCSSCCSGDSLPPEIVLKVMQSLRDEMKLRDETREAENARAAVQPEKFKTDAKLLADKQDGIKEHTEGAARDILALPDGNQKFGKELKLLNAVVAVMDEAQGILEKPDTGAKAIAAETEAIELLLQAKRAGKGGGGGGSNPGGGGRAASASAAALADLGPGENAESTVTVRAVGQATGHAGKEFPEEFKTGLDAYFNLLESQSARQ